MHNTVARRLERTPSAHTTYFTMLGRVASGCSMAILAVLLSSCASAPTLLVTSLFPALSYPLPKGTRIAIFPRKEQSGARWMGGQENRVIEDKMIGMLTNHKVNGEPYFNVVDRSTIDRVLTEQLFGQSGYLDPNSATKVGQIVGVEYAVSVNATYNLNSWHRKEKLVRVDPETKDLRPIHVKCEVKKVIVRLYARLTEVQTSAVKHSKEFVVPRTADACERGIPRKIRNGDRVELRRSPREMANNAVNSAMRQFIREIAPHYATVNIALAGANLSSLENDLLKEFKFALKLATGNFGQACNVWKELGENTDAGFATHFNIAVCYEQLGDLERARSAFDALSHQLIAQQEFPPQLLEEAIYRVAQSIHDRAVLQEEIAK